MSKTTRKYYIDNLRWACILLLVPFHAAMAWNCWEGSYIWYHANRGFGTFVTLISPWYMSLLFILAGVSTRLSLTKRSYGQFIKERLLKLLLPLVTGMVTVVATMTYYADRFYNGYSGSFISHYQTFFTQFTDLTGYDGCWTPGHLWFLLYLFIISMLCLIVIVLQRHYIPKLNFANMNALLFSMLGLLPLVCSQVLNFGGKSVLSFMVLYLIGYYFVAEESVIQTIVRYRSYYLILFLISDILDVYMFLWMKDANGDLNLVMMYFACWFGILTMIGFGSTFFNQNNRITRYLTSRSFLFYIFHFIWLVIIQFYLCRITANTFILFVISVIGTYILTFLTCEVIVRIPVIRFLYGVKMKKQKAIKR